MLRRGSLRSRCAANPTRTVPSIGGVPRRSSQHHSPGFATGLRPVCFAAAVFVRAALRTKTGGEGGIRTPGAFQLSGFQDRRNRPLCHLSVSGFEGRSYGEAMTVGKRESQVAFPAFLPDAPGQAGVVVRMRRRTPMMPRAPRSMRRLVEGSGTTEMIPLVKFAPELLSQTVTFPSVALYQT